MNICKPATVLFIILSIIVIRLPSYSLEESPFKAWLRELKAEAEKRGFSEKSIAAAFSEIKEPVERIVSNDRKQAEDVESYKRYLSRRVTDWKKIHGRKYMEKHREVLNDISRKYGVQSRFIAAIWGMETNYGNLPVREPVFSALATLAYDKRRSEFFRSQFFDALKILESGFPPYEKMKSSWAGAMGQCQFMPENYIRFAVDYNNDGKRDIWNDESDVLASIANYLSFFGWNNDETWGRRVLLPEIDEKKLFAPRPGDLPPDKVCAAYKDIGVWRDLQEWQKMGVRRINGTDLPRRSIPAALIIADKGDREGYIIYRDFCSIMRFNPSFKYALSIGLLSDLLK